MRRYLPAAKAVVLTLLRIISQPPDRSGATYCATGDRSARAPGHGILECKIDVWATPGAVSRFDLKRLLPCTVIR